VHRHPPPIVPRQHLAAVAEKLRARLAKTVVGDPSNDTVRMGALASHAQAKDVAERVAELTRGAEVVYSAKDGFNPIGVGVAEGAFFAPTLLLAKDAASHAAHDVEAFGPVSTLMPYDGIDEAIALAARGRGSLVGTLVTKSPATAAYVVPQAAAWHGRLLVLDREAAVESTGTAARRQLKTQARPRRRRRGTGASARCTTLVRAAVQGSPPCRPRSGEYVRARRAQESDPSAPSTLRT
jgi:oxepin-CoA hydrolase/3-oxo-5,6-dehydrosuberyl-CoA semialdehyde dehydrogenase